MTSENEKGVMSLEAILGGGMKPGADLGPADVTAEGSFRRGYHHCAANIASLLKKHGQLSAEVLAEWVAEEGMKWRKDAPLDRKIMAPALPVE